MKPPGAKNTAKKMVSGGTGGRPGDEEDDPVGLIPRAAEAMSSANFGGHVMGEPAKAKVTTREVSIKGGQFPDEEPTHAEMGTSMDLPPLEETQPVKTHAKTATAGTSPMDEAATKRMQKSLEERITDGRRGGTPSEELDSLMVQMTQLTANMVAGRKELLSGKPRPEETNKEESKGDGKADADKKPPKESNKQKRDRLREQKKQKQRANTNAWRGGTQKTAEEAYDAKHNDQFVRYYKGLGILPEEEWDVFYEKLKEPLDISFRVNSIDKHQERTLNRI